MHDEICASCGRAWLDQSTDFGGDPSFMLKPKMGEGIEVWFGERRVLSVSRAELQEFLDRSYGRAARDGGR